MGNRKLGKFSIAPIGFGCMGITHASGDPLPFEEGVKVVRTAYETGYTMFDTAECYVGVYPDGSIANNEEVVGEALKDVRDKVVIATKFGVEHGENGLIVDSKPETIRKSIEGSLKRLQTDHIDLYYQHRIDPEVEPEVVAGVMKELIEEGKILGWGISETDEEYLRRAHAVCPVTAIQNRYSMLARWYDKMFAVCKELGVTYVAFSPMANGFLTGAYKPVTVEDKADYRTRMPQYSEEGFAKAQELFDLMEKLAEEKNCTKAQLSLAWVLHKNPDIVPIPGSRNPGRIKENFASADVEITAEEMAKIDALLEVADIPVYGGNKNISSK